MLHRCAWQAENSITAQWKRKTTQILKDTPYVRLMLVISGVLESEQEAEIAKQLKRMSEEEIMMWSNLGYLLHIERAAGAC